ncbi:SDR family oxidoreductase [Oceanomicrobium pacificus]|uniref:SDR family NAD(P)-dependent oxidoreductase n=1 Tax=Oceanomicrobium pacificus TaxID=2692916 RepID=A0A6B0TVG9_9RHOB|nr:SDR family NAD(P)-dependent oxidoreductase [Oceanomicrobium pacificus]MXU65144.1 SDR family NAD(P)-dependent oxidoreductase [Oceanomicrobium pacificus]
MFNLSPVPVPALGGKSILVTGAGRGIGADLVRQLVDAGAQVFAGIHDAPEGADAERLTGATTLALDVTSDASVRAAVETVRTSAGRLDVLVNNAGIITPIGHLARLDSDALSPAFAVNVIGLHRMTRAVLPMLRETRGTIVNAGTGAATTAMEGWAAYCSSKAAARMMSEMMALELKADGIRTCFIGIPPTDTEMQVEIRHAGLNPISQIPREDLVPVEVPASVMAWLCSDAAADAPGSLLDVRDPYFAEMMPERS